MMWWVEYILKTIVVAAMEYGSGEIKGNSRCLMLDSRYWILDTRGFAYILMDCFENEGMKREKL